MHRVHVNRKSLNTKQSDLTPELVLTLIKDFKHNNNNSNNDDHNKLNKVVNKVNNESSSISFYEILMGLEFINNNTSSQEIDEWIINIPRDEFGDIEFIDFVNSICKVRTNVWIELFKIIDRDNSGKISIDTLCDCIIDSHNITSDNNSDNNSDKDNDNYDKEHAIRIFSAFNSDKDGKLTLDEYLKCIDI